MLRYSLESGRLGKANKHFAEPSPQTYEQPKYARRDSDDAACKAAAYSGMVKARVLLIRFLELCRS